jgi:transcriptional regulator with XRE-family HTH domain
MRKKILKINRENNVKVLRKARDWTQQELADKTNFTKGYISRIEDGFPITFETAEKFANAFSVPIDSIFNEKTKIEDEIIKLRCIKNIKKYDNFEYLSDINDYDYMFIGKELINTAIKIDIDYDNIIIINSPDNTMIPTIYRDDIIFIDASENTIKKSGVYLFKDGFFSLKRVVFTGDNMNTIKVFTDNKLDLNYTEINGILEKFNNKVRGKMIGYFRNTN